MAKRILITGGAGFLGSNVACYLQQKLKDHQIICLDNLVRNGSKINARRIKSKGMTFIKGDIRGKKDLLKLPRIDFIVECSAEPSVLAAFDDPNYTIDTNLMGTVNCLELAKRDKAGFIFLSTSRVYPIETLNKIPFEEKETRFDWTQKSGPGFGYEGINETLDLSGARSLYGATKLSSELIITEYVHMFGLRAVINRLGVIAGPWQMGKIDQGIVGYWVAKHIFGGTLKYFGYKGSGKQLRDAIHVEDVCALIYYELLHLDALNGMVFNVGGGRANTFSLVELTQQVQKLTQQEIKIEAIPQVRRADMRIYITDNTKINQQTGWRPQKSLEDIVTDTVAWIKENKKELRSILG